MEENEGDRWEGVKKRRRDRIGGAGGEGGREKERKHEEQVE